VTVPDSFTPVIVAQIGASTFPWLGNDKKYHVSYDLQLTNASRLPATLTRVDVVDARRPTTASLRSPENNSSTPAAPTATAIGCGCSPR
jgi:hypothetical protein